MVRYKEYDNNFDKDSILDISIQVKFWRGIIFHHTAIPNGRNKIGVHKQRHYGKLVNRLHRLGWKYKEKGVWKIRSGWRYGMGYHFFIENDGGIYISRRWLEQIHGAHCQGIYLGESIKSHKDKSSLCVGWDYLKNNLTSKLKDILLSGEYNKLTYNKDNINFILKNVDVQLSDRLKKQLGSFVYVWKDIKGDLEEKEKEEKLKKELLKRGFKEQLIIKKEDNKIIDSKEELKKLNGLKVYCVLDVNKIGILGSYDSKVEIEGKFFYEEKGLILIPKRCRTRGHIIRSKFYYKEK